MHKFLILATLLVANINTCLSAAARKPAAAPKPTLIRTPSGHFFGKSGALDAVDYYIEKVKIAPMDLQCVGESCSVDGVLVTKREHDTAKLASDLNTASLTYGMLASFGGAECAKELKEANAQRVALATQLAKIKRQDRGAQAREASGCIVS